MAPGGREEKEALPRPGHPDIEDALLFGESRCREAPVVGDLSLLHPHHDDGIPLQPLRAMDRHERDALRMRQRARIAAFAA